LGLDQIAYPQWTDYRAKSGLDPLGMQNSSINLCQRLLPGISNVTLRMRYYGFYAWLAAVHARQSSRSTELKNWHNNLFAGRRLFTHLLPCTAATKQVWPVAAGHGASSMKAAAESLFQSMPTQAVPIPISSRHGGRNNAEFEACMRNRCVVDAGVWGSSRQSCLP
jgi:hypothetical protein